MPIAVAVKKIKYILSWQVAETGCIHPGVLNEFKNGIVELLSERLCSSVAAAMVPKDCGASPVRQFYKPLAEAFWEFTDLLYQTLIKPARV